MNSACGFALIRKVMSAVTANKKIVVVLGEQGCGMTLLLNRIAVKAEDAESYDLSCRISEEEEISLRLIDTGRYRSQEKQYMIDMFVYVADIALILHNSNSMTSPCYIQKVIANVQKIKAKLPIILVSTRCEDKNISHKVVVRVPMLYTHVMTNSKTGAGLAELRKTLLRAVAVPHKQQSKHLIRLHNMCVNISKRLTIRH